MRRFKSAVQLASLVIVIITGALAAAQEFPTKPIELAVPYAAGGSHDLTARALASVAHQYLGQPLLVVLKPVEEEPRVLSTSSGQSRTATR